jgi:hypothetical protein
MNNINVRLVMYASHQVETILCVVAGMRLSGAGGETVEPERLEETLKVLSLLRWHLDHVSHGLGDFVRSCDVAVVELKKPLLDASTVHAVLLNFVRSISACAQDRTFTIIDKDFSSYVDNAELFGPEVRAAFESSQRDIMEAGNCLASECGTACVFHLMRAAEFGLRALARDRNVEFKDKPLEEKEWGQILPGLEKKIRELGESPQSSWPSLGIKSEQIRFYAEVVQELRGFNDSWRKHVSHADTLAFYEIGTAVDILGHVRSFMQKLSTKVSEHTVTEMYWAVL